MKTSLDANYPSSLFAMPSVPGRTGQSTSDSYRAQAQNADITLTTREGDRITINSQSIMSHERRIDGSLNGSQRLLEQSMAANGMSFTVQGDLNDQEIADLTALLDDLNGIATDFFSGDLEEAVNGAMNIGDMGSISKLEATFSQTSLLSEFLSVPHPIPDLSGQQSDLFAKGFDDEPLALPSGQGVTDLLAAQWQQFLEALNSPDAPEAAPPPSARPQQQGPNLANSAGDTAKAMLERSKETMTAHPRLTSLMPSVAELAIQQARRLFEQTLPAAQLAKDTSAAFNKSFNSWLL